MLRIRSWEKWQGEAVYDRLRKRKPTGRSKPLSLTYIAVATNLDDLSGNFVRLAKTLGGGVNARGFLLMVLGYVGRNSPTTGVVRCSREQFGSLVLTDSTQTTTKAMGARVYDALIESGIASEIAEADVAEIIPPPRHLPGKLPGKTAGNLPGNLPGAEEKRRESPPSPPSGGASSFHYDNARSGLVWWGMDAFNKSSPEFRAAVQSAKQLPLPARLARADGTDGASDLERSAASFTVATRRSVGMPG